MSAEKLPLLLIVEDDRALQKQIRWAFDQYEALTADDRETALQLVRRYQPPVVTMDLGLPPDADSVSEGFKLLEEILTLAPDTKIIVLTGQNDRVNALRAIALGAYDFFAKPFEIEMLGLTIQRAHRLHELQKENERLQSMQQPDVLSGLLTRDPELRFTAGGKGIASFGVAVNRRWQQNGEWQEKVSFFNVTAWDTLGENCAASLTKGTRVIVTGRLEQREYETKEGEKRNVVEIVADEIGPSMRWARAEVERISRDGGSGGGGNSGGGGSSSSGTRAPDPVYGDEEPF